MTPRVAAAAVVVWSLVFAAPHLYWAAGGRAGLGSARTAADAALATPWFAAYNLAAAGLALAGAAVAVLLGRRRPVAGQRWWRAAVAVAAAVLLVRGAVGLALLVAGAPTGTAAAGAPPPVLLAVEPWFVVGSLAFGALLRATRPRPRAAGAGS